MSRVPVRRHLRREPEHYLTRPIAMAPEVERTKKPLGGISHAEQLVLLRDDKQLGLAVFKEGQDNAIHEAVASTLDDLLGWDIVPKTIISEQVTRYSGGRKVIGALSEWKPDTKSFDSVYSANVHGAYSQEDAMRIALFDLIAGNTDRHGGNILIEPETGRLWAIDNAWTFGKEGEGLAIFFNSVLLAPQAHYHTDPVTHKEERISHPALIPPGAKIPAKLLANLRHVDQANFRAALAGIPIEEINRAWKRKQMLTKRGRIPTSEEQRNFAYGREK